MDHNLHTMPNNKLETTDCTNVIGSTQPSKSTKTPDISTVDVATALCNSKKRTTTAIDVSGPCDESIRDSDTTQLQIVTTVKKVFDKTENDALTTTTENATTLHCALNQTCFFFYLGTPISVTREGRPKLQCINCEGALHSPLCGCFCNRCPPEFKNFLTQNAAEKFENKSSILCHVCHNSISEALK